MKKPSKRSYVFSAVLLIPLLVNLFGWNLYTYTSLGDEDLVIAISMGLSHNALSESFGDVDSSNNFYPSILVLEIDLEELTKEIIRTENFKLFAEKRMDPMQFQILNIIEANEYSDYRGFEFSWIFVSCIPLLISSIKRDNQSLQGTAKSRP